MNYFAEDRDVLRFPSDEEDISLYLNIDSVRQTKEPRSILEKQLMSVKEKSPQKEHQIAAISRIFASPKIEEKTIVCSEEFINIFETKPQIAAIETDELAQAFEEVQKESKQKRNQQVSNHNLPRPRGSGTVLQNQVVLRSGKSDYYTDDEFKQYIQSLGGKTCSKSATRFDVLVMCKNYNAGLLERAQKQFSKRLTEEQFHNYIVNMTVVKLEQEREIQRSLLSKEQISDYIRSLPWVTFDESLEVIEISEIELHYAEQLGGDDKTERIDLNARGSLLGAIGTANHRNDENKSISTVLATSLGEKNGELTTKVLSLESSQFRQTSIADLSVSALTASVTSSISMPVKQQTAPQSQPVALVFHEPTSIQQLFHSRVAGETLKNELLRVNRPVLISGPTGQGKFLLICCAAREIGFDIVVYNSETALSLCVQSFGSPLHKPEHPRILVIKEVDMMNTRDITWLSKYVADLQKAKFPLILTTRDPFSPKLRALRKACTEIALEKLGNDAILEFVQQTLQKDGKFGPEQIERIVERVKEAPMNDVRALVHQLNFMFCAGGTSASAVSQIYQPPSINQILINALTYGQKHRMSIEDLNRCYQTDPLQVSSGMVANYLLVTEGQLKPSIFMAEHLSSADVILEEMYELGVWGAAKQAASFGLIIPALISPIFKVDIEKWGFLQTHFPVLGLERQLQTQLNRAMRISQSGMRCSCGYETELIVQITDLAFAEGEQNLDCESLNSEDFCDLSEIYGAEECKGKLRKDLLECLDSMSESSLMRGKKLVK